jgi:hypothetical protein
MRVLQKTLLTAVAFAALFLVALPSPAVAGKRTPCWKQLINDWYDGRIDKTYPIHCYQEAISRIPSDAQDYSSAPDDIRRALLAAIRDARGLGPPDAGPVSAVPAPPPPNPFDQNVDDRSHKGFLPDLIGKLGPKNADDVPVPLLVLAAIALLLLGAAAASWVARWYQARRVEVAKSPARPAGKPAPRPREGA